MAKTYALKAEARDRAGKGVARALRRENRVPAVIYGDKKDVLPISLGANEVRKEYLKGIMFTTLCEVELGGAKHLVLARDIQLDPVRDTVEHIDFLRVSPKTKISVRVPVQFTGEENSPGLVAKAVLNVVHHEVDLLVQATNIPDSVTIDLSGLDVGQSVQVKDLKLPQGAVANMPETEAVVSIVASRAMKGASTAGDEAAGDVAATEGDAA